MADDDDWHHLTGRSAKDALAGGASAWAAWTDAGPGPALGAGGVRAGRHDPLQALRVGTLYPAQTLGLDADLGSLEAGKLADFVVLDKNPLDDITNSTTVGTVVKNGRAYTQDELARHAAVAPGTD
jgi:imidazolonepropionase-like amidohydrolase